MSQHIDNDNSHEQRIPVNAADGTIDDMAKAEHTETAGDKATDANDAVSDNQNGTAEVPEPENTDTEPDNSDTQSNSQTNDENDGNESSEQPAQDEAPKSKASETDWRDSYVRLAADFDNYRKRTAKEFDDVRRRERERVVGYWLEVYDNAERALASMQEKSGPWFEGFSSLIQQMDKCLAQLNIKPVDDVGQKFDPKRHEAIATLPNPQMENNTIMFVERKGFVYDNGDIARVARVIVVKNPS